MSEIYKIIIVALAATFIILVLTKTGLRDKTRDAFDLKHIEFMAKMIDCDLCLSFWLSVCICISETVYTGDVTWLTIPIFSTPITRFLL